MSWFRNRLNRLERVAREEMIAIPQKDGTVARFPKSAYAEAFLNCFDRMGAGEDAPPRHPLLIAAANSSDQKWRESYFADLDYPEVINPIEDLSE